jgi:hypothetical protein
MVLDGGDKFSSRLQGAAPEDLMCTPQIDLAVCSSPVSIAVRQTSNSLKRGAFGRMLTELPMNRWIGAMPADIS